MAKTYTGNLSLEWYNKQKSIALLNPNEAELSSAMLAPHINWVNKEEALFYEIDSDGGVGQQPYWVNRNDIRVKEARPLVLQKVFKSIKKDKAGTIPGMQTIIEVEESKKESDDVENFLIKGDNLLALNTLKKVFENKRDEDKIKCIYIDPPYNTGSAFEHYDDNLENSEWLTLLRDRLILLYDLLSNSGVLFVQISDKQVGYLQVLLDEIFGKKNFINKITVRTKSPSGFQTVNLGVFETAEYILLYGKDKSQFKYNPQFTECDYDTNYNKIIVNKDEKPSKWKIANLIDFISKKEGYKDTKEFKAKVNREVIENLLAENAIKYSDSVFRLTAISDSGAGKETVELKKESKNEPDKIFVQVRDDYSDRYITNGQEIAFYSKKIKVINGKSVPTVPLTNIWTDIAWEGIAKEGDVEFQKSKKPERLIKRILEMSTEENDYVLDCFAGSGTTAAVAHKMKRKWITIEIGNHADSHIIPRLISILDCSDESGVTTLANWKGGGSFKYYHLGNSIIKVNKDGTGDFNWSLDKRFIEESFLLSYDYTIDSTLNLSADKLFSDLENKPVIGIQRIGSKNRVAIVSLNEPKGKLGNITYDELQSLYKAVKKKFSPEYINIFTNRGIEIAYDSKPDDLEVVKVPNAIFVELEK